MLPMTVKSYLKRRGIDISGFKGRALRQHQRSTKPGHRGYVLNWLCVWEAKPSAFQMFRRTAGHSLCVCVCVCVLVTQLCPTLATPWTISHQAPLSVKFSRQEYWSGLPFSSPGDLPDPDIKPGSPALQADALPSELLLESHGHLGSVDTLKEFIILVPLYPLAQFSCYLIVCVSSQTVSSEGVVIVSFLLPLCMQ